MSEEPIVAVALLTRCDLDDLGTSFRRLFAVGRPDSFADLLEKLDTIGATPVS
jgi:hypothetical protein